MPAAWFFLVAGLVEGIGLLLFQNLQRLSWEMCRRVVTAEISWISLLFDLLPFGGWPWWLLAERNCFPVAMAISFRSFLRRTRPLVPPQPYRSMFCIRIDSSCKRPIEKLPQVPNYQGAIKSVITPQGHYIFHEKLVEELYEWEKDPAEDNDLAKTSDGRRITEELADRLPGELREARKEK